MMPGIQFFAFAAALWAVEGGEHAVYISEYVEGQGHDEAVEVSNRGGSAVSLTFYSLVYYPGSYVGHPKVFPLTGTLEAGESRVYAHHTAAAIFDSVAETDAEELDLDYHGSDPVSLRYNETIIDLVGTFPMYGPWLQRMALRRDPTAALNPGGFPSIRSALAIGWQWFPENTLDGLGCEGFSSCS